MKVDLEGQVDKFLTVWSNYAFKFHAFKLHLFKKDIFVG